MALAVVPFLLGSTAVFAQSESSPRLVPTQVVYTMSGVLSFAAGDSLPILPLHQVLREESLTNLEVTEVAGAFTFRAEFSFREVAAFEAWQAKESTRTMVERLRKESPGKINLSLKVQRWPTMSIPGE
jgi:hypothetical protein